MVSAQIKNSFTGIGEVDSSLAPSSLSLKLALTFTSMRYFVLSKSHQQVIFYGHYSLHHVTNYTELAERISKIYEKDEVLQLKFGEILIGLDTPYSLLPAELSFMAPANKISQLCKETSVNIVYDKNEELLQTISGLFPGCQFAHLNSTFMHALAEHNSADKSRVFVNVALSYFDIIHFDEGQKLRMMNRYEYKTETDFIYFLLLYFDEMKLERETTELILIGEVDIQSKVYDICYRYFSHIIFISKPEQMNFTKAFDRFPKHLHYNLYNLSA